MALLACHTLRHSFNAAEHARLKQRQATVGLFVTNRQPQASQMFRVESFYRGAGLQQAQVCEQKGRTTTRLLQFLQASGPTSVPTSGIRAGHQGTDSAALRAAAPLAPEGAISQPASSLQSATRVEQLQDVIAANLPVFYFHPKEQYFPCTVDWFLERCQLALIRRGWRRQLLALLAKQGSLNGDTLQEAQSAFDRRPAKERRRQFMLLQLDPSARAGQPGDVNQIPIYAHVKELVDPKGSRDALEINYMKFLAYNGSYKPFGWIPAGALGAHDADWEHVTVRLSPDARSLLGVYYSAHRHRDGVWRSADEVPLTPQGRICAHVALDGHGSYPKAGFIPRVFFAFNDQTSSKGVVWQPEQVVIVTPPGQLPQVPTRGAELNGSSLPALRQGGAPHPTHDDSDSGAHAESSGSGLLRGQRGEVGDYSPVPVMQPSPWLAFEGRWGSTVDAPACQEWFYRAEHPVSRTWLQQVLLPLMPGVESIWEPVQEQVEEAVEDIQQVLDEVQEAFDTNLDTLRGNVRDSSEDVKQRYKAALQALLADNEKGKQGEHRHEEVYRRLRDALEAVKRGNSGKGDEGKEQ